MEQVKIFGIGLNKTGTTTLNRCGKILGLNCSAMNRGFIEDVLIRKDLSRVGELVNRYDLFEDWPWPLIYRELDQMFPGSKFILTVRRSEQKWLGSLKAHSMTTHPYRHCRKLVYGCNYPHNDEQAHLDFYRRHNSEVREWFQDRQDDFIELCWENGDGFEELCGFLGCDIPAKPFPHARKGSEVTVSGIRLFTNKLLRLATK